MSTSLDTGALPLRTTPFDEGGCICPAGTCAVSRALSLSQYAVFYNDPGLINTRYQQLAAVTAADVQRVAKQYLTAENRTVVITNPKPSTGPNPAPGGEKGGR